MAKFSFDYFCASVFFFKKSSLIGNKKINFVFMSDCFTPDFSLDQHNADAPFLHI